MGVGDWEGCGLQIRGCYPGAWAVEDGGADDRQWRSGMSQLGFVLLG